MKLLIIEDEIELQNVMKQSLEKEGYRVEVASTYYIGEDKILSFSYDCILLDIMLPDGNGIDLLSQIKAHNINTPVIIISAKDSVEDKVKGLEIGADDYLTKPFHLAEFHARVKAAVRRSVQEGSDYINFKNIKLSPSLREAKVNDKDLILNRKEFELLYYFIVNANRLITKTSLAEYVWGDHAEHADNLDFIYSQIKNLRKKLSEAGAQIEINSVYGIGYKAV